MLITRTPRTVAIPHEPGQTMDLVPLTWDQIKSARNVKLVASMADFAGVDSSALAALAQQFAGQQGEVSEALADPMARLDQYTVLRLGIVGWSYPEPVSDETIRMLDVTTADWAAEEILGVERLADRKNDYAGSIDPLREPALLRTS